MLVFLYLMNLGNRREIPFSGSTMPTAARWTGETLRSAALISHTWTGSNQSFESEWR